MLTDYTLVMSARVSRLEMPQHNSTDRCRRCTPLVSHRSEDDERHRLTRWLLYVVTALQLQRHCCEG